MDNVDKKEIAKEESVEKGINVQNQSVSRKKSPHWLKALGPGVITGASDDDPSCIATPSRCTVWFWDVMDGTFSVPIMTVIQEMCARIGLITGNGLTAVIKRRYSKRVVFPLTSLLLIANTINIGADIGAMVASVRLVFPQLPIIVATLSFTVFIVASQVLVPYNKYVKILKYLTISLFAHIITAVIVGGNWNQLLASSIIPHIEFTLHLQ